MDADFDAETKALAAIEEAAVQTHCGTPTRWDATHVGTTIGGLVLEGAYICDTCGVALVSRRARPAELWKLAKGGRSIDTGAAKIRAEAGDGVEALMLRLVRLPELERELERLRRFEAAMLAMDAAYHAAIAAARAAHAKETP